MLTGALFNDFFARLNVLTPWLIFTMLLVTFCKVSLIEMRLRPLHGWLILIQLAGSVVVYLAVYPFSEVVAQGALICVLAPIATAAVVVAGMLGANVVTMATYSLLCNLVMAAAAPVLFSFIGTHVSMPFGESFFLILGKVTPVLVLPFVAAWLLEKSAPRVHRWIRSRQPISFYLWAFSLTIVMGRTVHFVLAQPGTSYRSEMWLAVAALVLCIVQFAAGRRLGTRYGDTVAGGQSLGQKNTILAIWMAQTYLNPLASVAPAAYVVWQNLVNSYQIWRKTGRE